MGPLWPYLSHVLLKHAQLQTLVEAELTVLPRPLHLVLTLSGRQKDTVNQRTVYPSPCSPALVRRTCMTWCRTPMMP